MPNVIERAVVFATPWFEVRAKTVEGLPGTSGDEVYYSLRLADYVSVLAITEDGDVVVVRQYRPALERMTLELPSGAVDDGETPEQAARRELLEETGFQSDEWRPLGALYTDVGRLENQLWCFLATNVRKTTGSYEPEPGVDVTIMPLARVLEETSGELDHAENVAVLGLALVQGAIRPS